MNKHPKEKAATLQKKLLPQTTNRKANTNKARNHLLGVCLIDALYIQRLPVSIHFSEKGMMTLALISQGMGLDAIIRHLEAVGLDNAHQIIMGALVGVPDALGLSTVFYDAVKVITESMVTA